MVEQVIVNGKAKRRIKPDWLKISLPKGNTFIKTNNLIKNEHALNTICVSGRCPNLAECWGRGTATFMIGGDTCTRSCGFCAVKTGTPDALDPFEPAKVAQSIKTMGIKHCVITSVDRDDLRDGGAQHWVNTIRTVKAVSPGTTLETLIPDFLGDMELVQMLVEAKPEIISHNMETVRRLTPQVRSRAKYDRSLAVLKYLGQAGATAKTGIMLGLGETEQEVLELMDDVLAVGCRILTIGQYLQPTHKHLPVQEYVDPEVFERLKQAGLAKGFRFVESGPLVRSSYFAEKHVDLAEK